MSGASGPVLVCGLGNVGTRIVELLLRLGEPVHVVTLEARAERSRALRAAGVVISEGDARDEKRLLEAGLLTARALVVVTDRDLVNVEVVIDSRRLRPDLPIVVRLFDQQLARRLETDFGLRRALGMSTVTGPLFAAAALGERFVGLLDLGGEAYALGRLSREDAARSGVLEASRERVAVLRDDPAGLTVAAPREVWHDVNRSLEKGASRSSPSPVPWGRRLVDVWCGIPRGLRRALVGMLALVGGSVLVFRQAMRLSLVDALYFIVTTVTTTGYGDISPKDSGDAVKLYACLVMVLGSALTAVLFSIVTDFVVKARVREALGGRRRRSGGHVIVAGLGNLGLRTVEALRLGGVFVVAVDRDGSGEFVASVKEMAEVVVGDARLPEVLARAGVAEASAIVCTTGDDAVNLGVALTAREASPSLRTAVRLFDPDFAAKAREAFGLDAAMSASLRAAPLFVASVLEEGVLAAFVEANERLVIVRRVVAGPIGASGTAGPGDLLVFRSPGASGPFRPVREQAPLREGEWGVVVSSRLLAPAARPEA